MKKLLIYICNQMIYWIFVLLLIKNQVLYLNLSKYHLKSTLKQENSLIRPLNTQIEVIINARYIKIQFR
jgi:hypothetical protein